MRLEADLDRSYQDYLERQGGLGGAGGWGRAVLGAAGWLAGVAAGGGSRVAAPATVLLWRRGVWTAAGPAPRSPGALLAALSPRVFARHARSLAHPTTTPPHCRAGVRDAAERAKRKRLGDGGELGSDEEGGGGGEGGAAGLDAATLAGYNSASEEEEEEVADGLVVKLDQRRAGGLPGPGAAAWAWAWAWARAGARSKLRCGAPSAGAATSTAAGGCLN
jgi:hypothetical protein